MVSELSKKGYSGQLAIAIGAILISFSAVFAHATTLGPTASAFYRMFFGGVALAIVCVLRRENMWAGWNTLWYNSLAGLFLAIDLCFWHRSITHIGPGLATILGNCQVFGLIMVGAVFHGEKFNNKFFVAMGLAVLGMILLVGDQWSSTGPGYKIGVFQGLMTAVFYAGHIAYLQKVQLLPRKLKPMPNMVQICGVASLFLVCYAWFSGESIMIPDTLNWSYMLMYGVLGQGTGWILISYGLRSTPISVAGFLILLQPTLSFVWDITLFHRFTPPIEIVGAIITLGAIYLSTISKRTDN